MSKHQQLTAEFDAYLEGKMRVVLEALIEQLLLEKPADVQTFARDFLAKRHSTELSELELLRKERDSLREKRDKLRSAIAKDGTAEGEGEENLPKVERRVNRSETEMQLGAQEEETAEDRAKEEAKMKAQSKTKRQGVAAQSVDNQAVKDYKKPVHPKDDATIAKLRQTLKENDKMQVLFGHLDGEPLKDVINTFYGKDFDQGEDIIRQGDEGDCLYIVDAGEVDVFVNRPAADGTMQEGKGTKAITLGPGALFGELALMYNAPRAATVTASSTKVSTFVLNAVDFKMLLAQSGQAQYAKYEGWLCSVEMLKVLNQYELSKLADALETECYDCDEIILKQGDIGDKFYILEDGTAAAFIDGEKGEMQVKNYLEVGDYFGEVALLTSESRRKATVKATGQGCSVVSLSKEQFTEMLGPLSETLKLHADKYPQYSEFLKA